MRVMPGAFSQHASRGHPLSDYKRRRKCPLPSTSGLAQPIPILKPMPEKPLLVAAEQLAAVASTEPIQFD